MQEFVQSEVGAEQDFYKNIVATLNGEEEFFVKPEQARDVIRILELGDNSWEERRTVVTRGELIS